MSDKSGDYKHQRVEDSAELPVTLLDLLSNTLVFDNVVSQLPLSSIFALSRTGKPYQSFVKENERFFRHVDLSHCRGAYIPPSLTRVDSGGHSWRSQRMDEHLTEDDIYSGPLRGVLSKLSRIVPLQCVRVLVLDGMASVTSDFVSEILLDSKYDVWILSVVGCVNLNSRKLQQLFCYMCRPSRPEGSPRLKGLYYFGTEKRSNGKALVPGQPAIARSSFSTSPDPWYAPTGRVLSDGFARRSPWEETLQVCKGIIAFDAVLCTHMHQDMAPYLHPASGLYLAEHKPTVAPLASVALGPDGCAGCGQAPQGAPIWGESDVMEFPLLAPPPSSGQIVDAVRPPSLSVSGRETTTKQRLIVSCTWCLANRHCESCHRWWCGLCYSTKKSTKIQQLETFVSLTGLYLPQAAELETESRPGQEKGGNIKVFNGLCIENCLVGDMMAGAGSGGMWG